MPRASDELRKMMKKRFGSISDEGPIKFLENAGYKLLPDWWWEPKPGVNGVGEMKRDEFECLLFLAHEYDFGSLVAGKS